MHEHAKFRIKEYNSWRIEIQYSKHHIFWRWFWYDEYPKNSTRTNPEPGYHYIAYKWSLKPIFEKHGYNVIYFSDAFITVNEQCEWTERYNYLSTLIKEFEEYYNNEVDEALEKEKEYLFNKTTKWYIY